jgi:hypothetical protein
MSQCLRCVFGESEPVRQEKGRKMRMVGETQRGERQSLTSTTTVIRPQRVCLGQLIMHEVVAV